MLVPNFEQLDSSARPGPDETRKLVAAHLSASLPELERGPRSQGACLLGNLRKPAGRFEDDGGECVMGHKIRLAIVCLHISAGLYVLLAAWMFLFTPKDDTGLGLGFAVGLVIFCLLLVAGIEYVVYG